MQKTSGFQYIRKNMAAEAAKRFSQKRKQMASIACHSLSKKSPERVAFLCMIWYNKKGDENAAKGKKGKKSA